MRRRQAERSDTTRRAIIQAARDLFAGDGYDRTSIEQIAEKAGMSKGALYHHFRDKAEVLAAVYEDIARGTVGKLLAGVDPAADPIESLKDGTRRFLELCTTSDERQITLVDAPAVLGWQRWRQIDAETGGMGLLRAGLQAAADTGLIAPDQLEERAYLLMATLTEAALLIARSDTPAKTRAIMADLIAQELESLRRDGP
jgi:AcrR family transcriptional regulator